MKTQNPPVHPGSYIKDKILRPRKLSVKAAAEEWLEVSRSALSHLVNGNVALTTDMALRIEKAFEIDSVILLRMQVEHDKYEMREKEKEIAVPRFRRRFLEVRANEIQAYFHDNIEARAVLAAYLRHLVNNTADGLLTSDFPAYDNSQRHGWDGETEAEKATPWVPIGKAGWEFGVDQNPKTKAQHDYEARTKSIPLSKRKEIIFVFVTPRNWKGKNDWAIEKRKKKEWKDVRALDASDLEQWTEQSVLTQNWFYEKFGLYEETPDLSSLEKGWDDWASVTTPNLDEKLFTDAVNSENIERLNEWLKSSPTPLFIESETTEEAIAFLSVLLKKIDDNSRNEETEDKGNSEFQKSDDSSENIENYHYDRTIVISSPAALKKILNVGGDFIGVITSAETEKEASSLAKRQHIITIRTKDSSQIDPNNLITLERPTYETFRKALASMGIDEKDVERYQAESGKSLSVLRRRLSDNQAIKYPEWSDNQAAVRKIIPLTLAGNWDNKSKDDQQILCYLAGEQEYSTVEDNINEVLNVQETPIWAVNTSRGITSKIDALFAVRNFVTKKNIEDFFFIARVVLSEEDPALELPEDKRWAAGIYDKTRNHSSMLRESLCDTLILLSVFGNDLFQEKLGVNLETEAILLVRYLLKPFESKKWLFQQNELPRYAEAAPTEFLDILKEDLNGEAKIMALMKPANGGVFGSECMRTGLLWALEVLAWKPERLLPVSFILAQLSQKKLEDNWANKPINSLFSIYRSWLPQTSANLTQRIQCLKKICKQFPDVGWQLCIDQFDYGSRTGGYNARPRWRSEAQGAGDVVTKQEDYEFRRAALDISLEWKFHDVNTLKDLIKRLQMMVNEDVEKVWELIIIWHSKKPESQDCAKLRECIRQYAFTRRAKKNLRNTLLSKAKEIYALLTPENAIERNQWLFEKTWVEESAEEIEEEDFDYKKRDERIATQRLEALKEIWDLKGFDGVKALILFGETEGVIGERMGKGILLEQEESCTFLLALLSDNLEENISKLNSCMMGFLGSKSTEQIKKIILALVNKLSAYEGSEDQIIRLLKNAPFDEQTWSILESLPSDYEEKYWNEVNPGWVGDNPERLKKVIDRLIRADRPRAAFSVSHYHLQKIQSSQLVNLMRKVATSNTEPDDHYSLQEYKIVSSFETLRSRGDISLEDLANLEFLYVRALRFSDIGIPNLSKQIFEDPKMFMQLLALAYKRSDSETDRQELFGGHVEKRHELAEAAYSVLDKIKPKLNTHDDDAQAKKLLRWINDVRSLCKEYAREDIGDQVIGHVLARSPEGVDGIWPCEPIRLVLEEITSKEILIGMSVEVYNSRGVTTRGSGGQQERELAAQYRSWSEQLAFDSPYTADLLEQIARHYDQEAHWWDTEDKVKNKSGRW